MTLNKMKLVAILLVSSTGSWGMSGIFAVAQNNDIYPTYYRVHNVASNDVLNVRRDLDSGAPIIGSLPYNATPVEVLRQEHNWGYVAMGGEMGWVSMKHLRQIVPPVVGQSQIPVNLSCGGTEPFWGFQLGEEEVHFSHFEHGDTTFEIDSAKGFSGFAGRNGFVWAYGTLSLFSATFNTRQCSDGMSDLDYGWQVDLVLFGEGETEGLSGCCHLPVAQ